MKGNEEDLDPLHFSDISTEVIGSSDENDDSDNSDFLPELIENENHRAPALIIKDLIVDRVFRNEVLAEVEKLDTKIRSCIKSKEYSHYLWQKGKKFEKTHFVKAFNCYNFSLRYAEPEDQAFYIGERGIILFQMEIYDLALADFIYAENHGYPQENLYVILYFKLHVFNIIRDDVRSALTYYELQKNLSEFKEESLKNILPNILRITELHQQKLPVSRKRLRLEGFKQNPSFVNGGMGVKLKYVRAKKRFLLVAVEDLPSGAFLIQEEPYCSVLHDKYSLTHCDYCLSPLNLKSSNEQLTYMHPCRKCTTVLYCSPVCEKISWYEYHQFECGRSYYIMEPDAKLALRIILKAGPYEILKSLKNEKNLKNMDINWQFFSETGGTNYDRVYSIINKIEDFTSEELKQKLLRSAHLTVFLNKETSFFQHFDNSDIAKISDALFHHLMQIRWFSQPISEMTGKDKDPIGLGMYPSISLLDYAPSSNTKNRIINGRQMIISASTALNRGTEIFAPSD